MLEASPQEVGTRYRYTLTRTGLQRADAPPPGEAPADRVKSGAVPLGAELADDPSPDGERTVCFVMLNPSTATRHRNDPTIRRCIGFATDWGFDRLRVVNLFGARATRPAELFALDDPVGPGNDRALRRELRSAELVVAAWGVHGARRAAELVPRLRFDDWRCLGTTKDGHPRHPLYVRRGVRPVPWSLPTRR